MGSSKNSVSQVSVNASTFNNVFECFDYIPSGLDIIHNDFKFFFIILNLAIFVIFNYLFSEISLQCYRNSFT